jgi:hypothetical protein
MRFPTPASMQAFISRFSTEVGKGLGKKIGELTIATSCAVRRLRPSPDADAVSVRAALAPYGPNRRMLPVGCDSGMSSGHRGLTSRSPLLGQNAKNSCRACLVRTPASQPGLCGVISRCGGSLDISGG